MITLHAFGPAFGLPDPSPFVVKAMVQLRMAGQPFQIDSKGFFKAPKGKLPYIEDGGRIIADSTFIRWHLEEKYGVDLDQGLSPQQRALSWTIEKMLEDHCYWTGVYWRWIDDANFRKVAEVFFKPVPRLLRPLIGALVRRRMRGYLHAQGTGRHTEAEMMRIARQDVAALATLLGDQAFITGQQPCGADAILYAMMATVLCPHFESPLKQAVHAHPNLVAYTARMHQRYMVDLPADTSAWLADQAGKPSMQVAHKRSA
jgi:glutathione S-transferase